MFFTAFTHCCSVYEFSSETAEVPELGSNMIYKCAICEVRIYRPARYFCWRCYNLHKDDIREKKEWTRFVVNEESKRRRREANSPILVYLGDKWDIDTRGNLVLSEGFYYGKETKRTRRSR